LNAVSRTVANTIDLVEDDGNPIPAASRTGGTQHRTKGDGLAYGLGGRTALHYAAREGLKEAAAALVEAGADVNTVDPLDGSSALIVAIANGHYDLAKDLLDHGANPTLAMKDGLTALYATIETQWAPVSWTPTAFTAANGIVQQQTSHLELLAALLAHGADANARITKSVWFSPPHHNVSWARAAGATAFWRAAQADDVAAMRLLIAHGADPKTASSDGTTALAVAAGVGWAGNFSTTAPNAFVPATRYLAEEIGLDVNVANSAGYTALMGAAWRGDNELVTYLVEKGARLDARNTRGWSATDMANGPFIRGAEVPVKYPKTIALLETLGAPELVSADDDEVLGGKRAAAGNRRGQRADPDAPDADADAPATIQPTRPRP
jgi:ankyrin repeat protein